MSIFNYELWAYCKIFSSTRFKSNHFFTKRMMSEFCNKYVSLGLFNVSVMVRGSVMSAPKSTGFSLVFNRRLINRHCDSGHKCVMFIGAENDPENFREEDIKFAWGGRRAR